MSAPAPTLDPLAVSTDLTGLATAPLGDRVVKVAGADIRDYCGWHIAPVATATLVASGTGGPKLILPTLRPRTITSIRAYDGDGVFSAPLTGWRVVTGGMLYRPVGWPCGVDNIVVDCEHGFDTCPEPLLAALAERAATLTDTPTPGVRSETRATGGITRTRSYIDDAPGWSVAATAVLDRYRLPA